MKHSMWFLVFIIPKLFSMEVYQNNFGRLSPELVAHILSYLTVIKSYKSSSSKTKTALYDKGFHSFLKTCKKYYESESLSKHLFCSVGVKNNLNSKLTFASILCNKGAFTLLGNELQNPSVLTEVGDYLYKVYATVNPQVDINKFDKRKLASLTKTCVSQRISLLSHYLEHYFVPHCIANTWSISSQHSATFWINFFLTHDKKSLHWGNKEGLTPLMLLLKNAQSNLEVSHYCAQLLLDAGADWQEGINALDTFKDFDTKMVFKKLFLAHKAKRNEHYLSGQQTPKNPLLVRLMYANQNK